MIENTSRALRGNKQSLILPGAAIIEEKPPLNVELVISEKDLLLGYIIKHCLVVRNTPKEQDLITCNEQITKPTPRLQKRQILDG